jgi:hypothetical protein
LIALSQLLHKAIQDLATRLSANENMVALQDQNMQEAKDAA